MLLGTNFETSLFRRMMRTAVTVKRQLYLGVPVAARARAARCDTSRTVREAVDPLGVVDPLVGSNGLVVSGAVTGAEESDDSSIDALDRTGLGVPDAVAVSVNVIEPELEMLVAVIASDNDAAGSESTGAESEQQQKRLVHLAYLYGKKIGQFVVVMSKMRPQCKSLYLQLR
jgi:hypothetical protein